jgi:hypothetical protein
MLVRPHSLAPHITSARVALVHKQFAAPWGIYHIGLGVSCLHKCNVLWREGIWVDTWSISSPAELAARIAEVHQSAVARSEPRLSHVVIAAPWIPTADIARLVAQYRGTDFACICHSDVGFLQADTNAMRLVQEYCGLALNSGNFQVAGNSLRFVSWAKHALYPYFLYLPNLYDVDSFRTAPRPSWQGRDLRIGCFGATRALKNIITGAAAALEIARVHNVQVDFHVSSGRDDQGGRVYDPIRQILAGPRTKLVLNPWRPWPQFRDLIGWMDLNMQPSYTESFNICTADSIAEGVPACVSPTIDWVPPSWIARSDDAHEIAVTSMGLLGHPRAAAEGQDFLKRYVRAGIAEWKAYLGV